ncbi:PaaI family thioesterase [Pseudoclavibacter sp. Z016]|uniref:PaaI family thioesterase n=1 Tax=Pseudoclavibacter sp. Z016 TaxID=2080581 RepID=UPI002156F838|nr:PaaI family thioesterase [Pseudoclavibacter sp. Z016]
MHHLGARLESIEVGRVSIALRAHSTLTQQHGYVHAGATSAIADSAGGYAALTLLPAGSEVLTVEYSLNLLAPARGQEFQAVGAVIRAGRTLTVCCLDVWAVDATERTHIATGQQTLIRVEAPESDAHPTEGES